MARNDGIDRTFARNQDLPTLDDVAKVQEHNEREKDSYSNQDIDITQTHRNVHFKKPTDSYAAMFDQMIADGVISTRGLKADAVKYGELLFDVNSAYFHNHGGYEYAKQFYADAYKAAVEIVGGEQYILSAVMHADERNRAMSEALGEDGHLFTGVIIFIVKNPYIPQIQGFLNDFVGVDAFRTKGVLGADIPSVQTFSVYIPLAGIGAVMHLDVPSLVVRRPQKLKGKVPHDLGWQPGSTQPDRNLTGRQVNGLHRFQGLYIDGIPFICLGKRLGGAQLFPDIAGKVFICWQIFMGDILISVMLWVQEDHARQIGQNFFLALVGQLHHVGHINFCFFSQ